MRAISTITAGYRGTRGGAAGGRFHHHLRVVALDLPAQRAVRLAVLVAVAMLGPNLRGSERRPLDVAGLVLSGAALTAVLYGAELASQPGAGVWVAAGCVLGGLLLGWVAYRHAARHPHPLIDVSTLKIPTFSVTVVTGSLTRIGIGAVPT